LKRIEGIAKLTGRERYIDDLDLGEHLWGATVRSPSPRGRITEIRFSSDVDWSEFTIVDHTDVPGANTVFLLEDDQPVLAAGEVRHVHEPVLLLAHASRDAVRRAAKQVEVMVEAAEPYLDFRVAPTPEQLQRGDRNLLKRLEINKGDVEAALAAAPHLVEGVYATGAQQPEYHETQGLVAWVAARAQLGLLDLNLRHAQRHLGLGVEGLDVLVGNGDLLVYFLLPEDVLRDALAVLLHRVQDLRVLVQPERLGLREEELALDRAAGQLAHRRLALHQRAVARVRGQERRHRIRERQRPAVDRADHDALRSVARRCRRRALRPVAPGGTASGRRRDHQRQREEGLVREHQSQ
jgi:hypothetical protein